MTDHELALWESRVAGLRHHIAALERERDALRVQLAAQERLHDAHCPLCGPVVEGDR